MDRRKFLINIGNMGIISMVTPKTVFSKTVAASENYVIEQFLDEGLAHFSYVVMAGNKIIVIDPQRNPSIYYDYAKKNNAIIVGLIETHPHADFVSSHLEMHKKLNIPIYASSLTKPIYPYTAFDDGQIIKLSNSVGMRSIYTPGHAPDHIASVLYEYGKDVAVFSGDSLLIGDVGRPDLRDFSNDIETQKQRLAGMMYDTIHEKFARLADEVIVYPAHGAGSLCGRSMRKATSSTIGYEKQHNYAFEKRTKEAFINLLLSDQSFIPRYFRYNVMLNIKGAPEMEASIAKLKILSKNYKPDARSLVIDSRPATIFKASYIPNAINIQGKGSFETWLGTIVDPDDEFYLTAATEEELKSAIQKAASIGYETKIKGAFVYDATDGSKFTVFDKTAFNPDKNKYTHIDVRTSKEASDTPIFNNSINLPLQELSERISEIPTNKPILVNCASGYRSAIASSIIKRYLPSAQVYDLGAAVKEYKK